MDGLPTGFYRPTVNVGSSYVAGMHCLGAVTGGTSSPNGVGGRDGTLSVFRALGVLVCEGRIQGPPRGYKEGPHCAPPMQAVPNDHVCEENNYLVSIAYGARSLPRYSPLFLGDLLSRLFQRNAELSREQYARRERKNLGRAACWNKSQTLRIFVKHNLLLEILNYCREMSLRQE